MSVGVRQSILGKRFLRNFVVSKRKTLCRNLYNNSTTSSIAVNVNGTSVHNDETRVNKALRVYLESMKTQKQVMDEHKAHFDLGKRHLANMMGFDPDQMTQVA